mmetsp:Transcript_30238/g.56728  ORF Transcript_30238/g.56728 Transcript_30238/m.56728 type:complete len:80 (-) Transcript_30238:100-339(-)
MLWKTQKARYAIAIVPRRMLQIFQGARGNIDIQLSMKCFLTVKDEAIAIEGSGGSRVWGAILIFYPCSTAKLYILTSIS